MLYSQLFIPCPLPPEPFIIISEKGIRMKTIIAAISLVYNCHSLLWLDQKSTSLIAGLLRPFVTSKKLLLPHSCSVKFRFIRKGEKEPREAPGFSPSTAAKAARWWLLVMLLSSFPPVLALNLASLLALVWTRNLPLGIAGIWGAGNQLSTTKSWQICLVSLYPSHCLCSGLQHCIATS